MGTRITPEDPVSVVRCDCHPLGDDTPEKIYIYFWDVENCPAGPSVLNGHLFTLTQNHLNSCEWLSDSSAFGWLIHLVYACGNNQTEINVSDVAFLPFFLGVRNGFAAEYDVFPNQIANCGFGIGGRLGSCTIFWLEEVAAQVLDLNLPTDGDGLFLEFFRATGANFVNRYANRTYTLNKKVLFSP